MLCQKRVLRNKGKNAQISIVKDNKNAIFLTVIITRVHNPHPLHRADSASIIEVFTIKRLNKITVKIKQFNPTVKAYP